MRYKEINTLIETLENAEKYLFRIAYKEFIQVPLEIEGVSFYLKTLQEIDYRKIINEILIKQYEYDRIMLTVSLLSSCCIDTYSENGTIEKWKKCPESILYNKEAIVNRLKSEGNDGKTIDAYISEVYSLQKEIFRKKYLCKIIKETMGKLVRGLIKVEEDL